MSGAAGRPATPRTAGCWAPTMSRRAWPPSSSAGRPTGRLAEGSRLPRVGSARGRWGARLPFGPMSMGCQLLDHLRHRSYDQDGVHVVELEVSDDILGPGGAVHGGIIASLVDRAGAYAIARDSQRVVATSNMALNYLALADVGPL